MPEKRINRQWTVASRPVTTLNNEHFAYKETPVQTIQDGEMLLRTHYLNVAPVMRMYMMKDGAGSSPESSLALGDVIHGRGVAEVIESRHADYAVGDFVHGQLGWQTYKITRATAQEKIITMQRRGVPAYYGLSALGMTGYSAYCGFVKRGQPETGDAVLISGAVGGVGSLVVQIAKALGCSPVVGIAGSDDKCQLGLDLGADAMINYKTESVPTRIQQLLPDGIDVYFDNVGGPILEAALENLSLHARVVLCGSISEYQLEEPFKLSNYLKIRSRDADLRGFFVYNHTDSFEQAETQMAQWIKAGALRTLVDITDGFDNMPEALIGLYTGNNTGKQIVRVVEGEGDIF